MRDRRDTSFFRKSRRKAVLFVASQKESFPYSQGEAVSENSIWLPLGSVPRGQRGAACFLSCSTLLPQQGLHEGDRVVRLAASGSIDDKTNITSFRLRSSYGGQVAVFTRRKNARSPLDKLGTGEPTTELSAKA